MLQMLGAVAEFERALIIRERVASGLARAAREGRRGGNPGVVERGTRRPSAGCAMRARTPTAPG
jgi:DNA invertase Pin-like site-specific DNA recombinase